MDYLTICKYVFASEGIGWEIHDSKKRDRDLVQSRQISIYLGNMFYPEFTWVALGDMFGRDHATAMHAVHKVKDLMFSDQSYREKILTYAEFIKAQIKKSTEQEMQTILRMRSPEVLNSLLSVIDKMELVAKIYCEITNNQIVKL